MENLRRKSMEVNKVVEEVRSQLTGNKLDDYHFIKDKINELAKNPETVEAARALTPVLLEVVNPNELNQIREKMKREIANREALFAKAEKLMQENKFENAKVVLDKIAYQVKNLFEDDETYHYINIEEQFAFYIYTNLIYKGRKIVRFVPDHFYKYYYLLGITNMKLGLVEEAEKAFDESLRWFPNSFVVLLEKANVHFAKKELDKIPEVLKEAQKWCFVPSELARCYRAIGYYGFVTENYRLAMAGYLSSTIFDRTSDLRQELTAISQKMGQETFQPLTPDESKVELEKVGMLFGANMELLNMAMTLSSEFAAQKLYPAAIYLAQIVYGLTQDDNVKARVEELQNLANNK
jgi:tetratricopeptide (TPR) repeat protein